MIHRKPKAKEQLFHQLFISLTGYDQQRKKKQKRGELLLVNCCVFNLELMRIEAGCRVQMVLNLIILQLMEFEEFALQSKNIHF